MNDTTYGLTKREHFASMAMQALLSNAALDKSIAKNARVAEVAVACADALLAALESPK